MLALEVTSGPDRGRRFPLPPHEPQLIGRSSEAVPMTDRSVSRRHAELTPDGDRWTLRDLNSSNGTDINGTLLTGPTAVRTGDVIRCGQSVFRVIDVDEAMAGPARDMLGLRAPAPTLDLPPTPASAEAVLKMIGDIAALGPVDSACEADFLNALQRGLSAEVAVVPAEAADTESTLTRSLHRPEPAWVSITFDPPIECWQRSAVDFAMWLLHTMAEANRVHERDRLAAMGETIAIISHAVKNILQGLQGGAGAIELAIDRGDLDLAREGWPILARNLDRIHDLTFNMLAWSRTSHLTPKPGSLARLVAEVVALQKSTFESRRIAIESTCPPMADVPFDPAAMYQVVLNLVLNALEAAPPRRGHVRIETSVDQQRDEAVIAITDDGPGIPPRQQASIFEPFASTRGQRGTGLGLAVSRRIVAAHGGRLLLRCDPGRETRFEIRLPMRAAPGDPGDTDIPLTSPPDPTEFEP
jgi:signal transduction histidine kinase